MGQRPFLTARWQHLLMLNYAVDPALLAPHVPAGTTLDHHDGVCYVSLVAFQFQDTRILGVPVPWHRNFEEMNLRFYVRREARGESVRRAVVFLREIVPRHAIAFVARALYNEPYLALPMRSRIEPSPLRVEYGWRHGGHWQSVAAAAQGEPAVPGEGSHEQFISEHFWGYTRQRDGGTIEYRVEHPSWRIWNATDVRVDAELAPLYGAAFAGAMQTPASAFIAEGSPVTVSHPERMAGAVS